MLNSVYQRDASPSLQPYERNVPSALLPAVARVISSVGSKASLDGAALVKEAVQCAYRIKRMRLVQLNMELKYLMQEAADAGDKGAVRQFLYQVQDIQRQVYTIDSATPLQG
jgi:DNA primase